MWRRGKASGEEIDGARAEQLARRWLQARGLKLVAQNFRCRVGEIDLIMRDGEELVFVEVRYRKRAQYGGGLESVDWRKQKKLINAANSFLISERRYRNCACRFDVMAGSRNRQNDLHWDWIKQAFDAG